MSEAELVYNTHITYEELISIDITISHTMDSGSKPLWAKYDRLLVVYRAFNNKLLWEYGRVLDGYCKEEVEALITEWVLLRKDI